MRRGADTERVDAIERYLDLNARLVAGRQVILAGHVLAGATPWVAALGALGAERCFVLAAHTGTGPLPDDSVGRFDLGIRAATPSSEIQRIGHALANLPPEARAAINQFDPDREALVLTLPFLDVPEVDGRIVYGARPARWSRLEDKTTIDAMFDRAGITRAPSTVVDADRASLQRAATELDLGVGTVWAGDIRDGFHGGGDLVRWVRSRDDVTALAAWFAERCNRVRVAPFLEGVPCSIHGFVCDDGVAALRPMEMVILRRPEHHGDRSRFVYAGMASLWDPERDDRDAMRDATRCMGRLLAEEVGYRGAFTLDGIMSVDGFLPTEMNPRFGGALGYVHAVQPLLGLPLLHIRATAGDGDEIHSGELESLIVPASTMTRWASCHTLAPGERSETTTHDIDGLGRLVLGPSVAGTLARIEPNLAIVAPGPPFAPRAIEGFEFAARECGVELGPLVAATQVR